MPLINCEVEPDLKWSRNCALIEDDHIRGVRFTTTGPKLYVPVATFSINNNIKCLQNLSKNLKEQLLGTNIDLK